MRKTHFILKTGAFLAGLLALNAGLQRAYYAYVTPRDVYLQRQREFNTHQDPYDIVIFGDSYGYALQEELLGNAANFSLLGEGYVGRYYKIRYNLRKNPGKLKTIILPLDLHSLSPTWGEHFNMLACSRYVNFADYLWQNGISAKAIQSFVRYDLFPYTDFMNETNLLSSGRNDAPNGKVQKRLERRLSETCVTQKQIDRAMKAHYGEQGEWLSDKALRYLNRIKRLCQKQDVRVIFVRFPVSKHYVAAASKIVPIDEFDAFTKELVNDWPNAVVLDYRELYFGRDDLFSDINHLNRKGSTLFSERLRKDLTTLGALPTVSDPPVQ